MYADQSMKRTAEREERRPGLWRLMREDIRCVFDRDPAARTTWEVLTTYPGVHAILVHRIAYRLWGRRWRYSARFLAFVARMFTNVDIHPGARIGRRFFIDHGAGVVIGETAVVGDNVSMLHSVTLGGTGKADGDRHPKIENGVLIGAGAKVLGNITVGYCTRIAAGSVVLQDVPPCKTVAGVPARIVGEAGCAQPSVTMNQVLDGR